MTFVESDSETSTKKIGKLTVVKAAGRGMASLISCIFCRGLMGTPKDQLDNVLFSFIQN